MSHLIGINCPDWKIIGSFQGLQVRRIKRECYDEVVVTFGCVILVRMIRYEPTERWFVKWPGPDGYHVEEMAGGADQFKLAEILDDFFRLAVGAEPYFVHVADQEAFQ